MDQHQQYQHQHHHEALPAEYSATYRVPPPAFEYGVTMPVPEVQNVRQLAPQGRQSRRKNREAIEKELLRARNSNYERYGDEIEEPLKIIRGVPSYMSESDRFHTDVAGEAQRQRQADALKKDQMIRNLRDERLHRENVRWESMDCQTRAEEEYLHRLRVTGTKSRRNQSGSPFNPITLQLMDTEEGRLQQQTDSQIRARAQSRMSRLQKFDSGLYNTITGEPIPFARG